MIFANFYVLPYASADPGAQQYKAAMVKYEPGHSTDCFCEKGYAVAEWFLHALQQISGTPISAKLTAALNSTNGYTANGLVGPIQEPAFHTIGSTCLSVSIIKNGQWAAAEPDPTPSSAARPTRTPGSRSSPRRLPRRRITNAVSFLYEAAALLRASRGLPAPSARVAPSRELPRYKTQQPSQLGFGAFAHVILRRGFFDAINRIALPSAAVLLPGY